MCIRDRRELRGPLVAEAQALQGPLRGGGITRAPGAGARAAAAASATTGAGARAAATACGAPGLASRRSCQ
eukprot:5246261-Alexandrium_andersonii.AAC.1